ncbi:Uncharacterized protein OBRU01_08032 [Operophtera brumata]|uniref:Transmembrane protein n=1 Tax=Operophtera brumata TaxID=104452 RepID=A0A0L7LH56_OPEBR|nr:Uncharacterized protein OBRU01_08032 [Operophtera brumata]
MSTENKAEVQEAVETNGKLNPDKTRPGWIKFDDETQSVPLPLNQPSQETTTAAVVASTSAQSSPQLPAVLNTESVQVNFDRGDKNVEVPQNTLSKNVEFVTIRQGFCNGDIIVTVLPLTVEEYVHAMELLVNDARFTLYNICYKRVLVCWITLAFLVLLALLFSGLTGLTLFSLGVLWLVLNAAAIFLCMWIKLRLSKGLEQCLARVNKLLSKHKLILALDDRGKISCHKVNLCFIYFDSGPCIAHLQQFIDSEEGKTIMQGWEQRLDVTASDIVIQGNLALTLLKGNGGTNVQGMAEQVYLRYLQRWGKDFLRRRLDWTLDEEGGNPAAPRHLTHAFCPCQYAEEILRNKEPRDTRACCPLCNHWFRRRGLD